MNNDKGENKATFIIQCLKIRGFLSHNEIHKDYRLICLTPIHCCLIF